MNKSFIQQVELLLSVLPSVMKEDCFALKGGTAINFFWQRLPRLSVDIDLVYLPLKDRKTSLFEIDSALMSIKKQIQKIQPTIRFIEKRITGGGCITLSVIRDDVLVKIEPNVVLRGSIYPICQKDSTPELEKQLNISSFVTIRSLNKAELYGGKIVAALDRQHPRDFFDIRILFEQEGITDEIRKAFVVYLAGHNRPMHEILKPQPNDFETAFNSEFAGMTLIPVTIDELQQTRFTLFDMIPKILTDKEKQFLLSIKKGEPEWDLLPVQNLDKLSAIQWKLQNIGRLDKKKHCEYLTELEKVLG